MVRGARERAHEHFAHRARTQSTAVRSDEHALTLSRGRRPARATLRVVRRADVRADARAVAELDAAPTTVRCPSRRRVTTSFRQRTDAVDHEDHHVRSVPRRRAPRARAGRATARHDTSCHSAATAAQVHERLDEQARGTRRPFARPLETSSAHLGSSARPRVRCTRTRASRCRTRIGGSEQLGPSAPSTDVVDRCETLSRSRSRGGSR